MYNRGMSATDLAATRTFDENVAAVVRLLLATANPPLDAVDLAPRVGITKSTIYNRLHGKPWLAAELDRIAAYFEVSPAIFYQPVDQVVQVIRTQNWKKLTPSHLHVLPGSGSVRFDTPHEQQRLRLLHVVPEPDGS